MLISPSNVLVCSKKNSHQLMAGPLSCRLCPSISRNNEKKMTNTTPMSIYFEMAAAAVLFLMDSSQKLIRSSEIPRE